MLTDDETDWRLQSFQYLLSENLVDFYAVTDTRIYCVTTGFIIVTPRVRRATKAPLDGTTRFSVCLCVETKVEVKTTLVN